MRKIMLLLLVIGNISGLFCQDIIYSISGLKDGQATYLDSILFENLNNSTRLLYTESPNQARYSVNLSEEATSLKEIFEIPVEEILKVVKMIPGEIDIQCTNQSIGKSTLTINNLNGQKLFNQTLSILNPGDIISVHIPNSGIYFVCINTPYGRKNFKVLGSIVNKGSNYKLCYKSRSSNNTSSSQIEACLKNSMIQNTNHFSFKIGDSIRVTPFLTGYYTYPHITRITGSKNINFILLKSTVDNTGISDLYKPIDKEDYIITELDENNGETRLRMTSNTNELKPGDIITINLDSTGLIQKVVSVNDNNGSMTIETVPAYMDDLFVNKEFKLNTKLIEPQTPLKSTSSPREIMNALTDKDGYIHPVKVVYYDSYNRRILKSTLDEIEGEEHRENIIDFYKDFSNTDLYGKEGDNIHFFIDEGYAELKADAVFEFKFTHKGELTEDTKVKKGKLYYFKFYLDSKADFMTKLALDMSLSKEKEQTKKLATLVDKATAHFLVPPGIPVWITFDCDIYGQYHFDAHASLHADWGFESHHQLQVGGIYDKATKDFTPFKEYIPENTVYPLNVEGEAYAFARLELYPRVDVKFYSFFGPYAEIVPFLESEYNAAYQSQSTLQGNETFFVWNSDIDLGLDLRIGTELSFLGLFEREFFSKTINCFNFPLWKSPVNIELITDIPESVDPNTTLELQVKVTDYFKLPVTFCPVYFNGDGTFSKQIPVTDMNGIAKISWSVGETAGDKYFTATIFKADKSVIKTINYSTNITSGISDIIFNPDLTYGSVKDIDGNTYKTIQIGTQTWMAENLKTTKYNDGQSIPLVTDNTAWAALTTPAYCWYDNDAKTYKATYGTLYNWYVVSTITSGKNVCPSGWHVPTDEEWATLIDYLGGMASPVSKSYTGNKLKETGTTHWQSPNEGATNESGFTALPGGRRINYNGNFRLVGIYGNWWSATEVITNNAWGRNLEYSDSEVLRIYPNKQSGLSVRCVRD